MCIIDSGDWLRFARPSLFGYPLQEISNNLAVFVLILFYMSTGKRTSRSYKKEARAVGETSLPEGSLKFYLEKSPEYIGTKNSVRFKNVSNGYFDVVTQKDENGREVTTYKQSVVMAMAFDYDMLSTHYNINLEVSNTTEPDEFGK